MSKVRPLRTRSAGRPPRGRPAQLLQLLGPLHDRGEVVAGELAHLAREAGRPVWEEDLDLREAAGIEEELARRGIAVRVLRADAKVELEAHGHPGGLAAPARLHELAAQRQQGAERGDRLRRGALLEARREAEAAGGDGEHGETLHARFASARDGAHQAGTEALLGLRERKNQWEPGSLWPWSSL